ncbi:hypothetical protein CHLNCDRAFT_134034 [Chlorella variabilis]|uniref:F-box domain-containing protein n=1 Tax=Chlorella variabilis TaxID=554065 RepID=E1ZEU6_CHLVA|nr:hypothetical protein CHLNCDRAFT_134034 [Chlorella variabilis]EFN55560.1 hypothetical protein CHLNCDRAFT_134034 [Chlorella variabilis]|eukprot:XP_005847662.1 hypothetical protein CHLNCDRAFT_134034 [Chlorella variabilis]
MEDSGLEQLPKELVREVLARLSGARDLASVACSTRRLTGLVEDKLWGVLVMGRLARLAGLLDSSPAPPEWWVGRSWRERLSALVAGLPFEAQVFNRELENEQEDFLLSSYDATCSLTPATARGLLRGDAAQPMRFTARYLCMGQMPAVVEAEVAQERLRLAPAGSSPFAVFGGGSTSSAGLCIGEEVEVQWKGRRSHPFGWWFGTVQSVRGNRITLVFRQYPRTSVWHRVKAPIKPGKEAVVNGDCSFGYVGGLRRLTGGEREEWRRHGAPHPPAPEQLAALEAAAEDEWSDEDEDLDIDAELAAEMEEELEELPAAPHAADGHGAAGAAQAAGAGVEAMDVVAAEEAAPGPAAPPGQPIALQLGQPAGVAGAANGAGLPVVLAGGLPEAAPHQP